MSKPRRLLSRTTEFAANKLFKAMRSAKGHWKGKLRKKLKRVPKKDRPRWKPIGALRKLRGKLRSKPIGVPKSSRSKLKWKPNGPNKRRLNSKLTAARRKRERTLRRLLTSACRKPSARPS